MDGGKWQLLPNWNQRLLWARKKVGNMGKEILITVLALMTAVAFVGGVWGQKNSPPATFSGTITRVDSANKEIVVQNRDGGMTFQWSDETQVNGPPAEKSSLDSKSLKEGMKVTVLYKEGDQNRVANRIDVEASKIKALKGFSLPFECGTRVC